MMHQDLNSESVEGNSLKGALMDAMSLARPDPLHSKINTPTFKSGPLADKTTPTFRLLPAYDEYNRQRAHELQRRIFRRNKLIPIIIDYISIPNKTPTKRFTVLAEDSNGKAYGTLCLTFGSPSKLPCDQIFEKETNALRKAGRKICEVTGFALEESAHSRSTLIALFNLIYIYALRVCHQDDFVIEVHPRHAAFYHCLLGFTIQDHARPCPRANLAPAVLLRLVLAFPEAQIAHWTQPDPRNVTSPTEGRQMPYRNFLPLRTEIEIASQLATNNYSHFPARPPQFWIEPHAKGGGKR